MIHSVVTLTLTIRWTAQWSRWDRLRSSSCTRTGWTRRARTATWWGCSTRQLWSSPPWQRLPWTGWLATMPSPALSSTLLTTMLVPRHPMSTMIPFHLVSFKRISRDLDYLVVANYIEPSCTDHTSPQCLLTYIPTWHHIHLILTALSSSDSFQCSHSNLNSLTLSHHPLQIHLFFIVGWLYQPHLIFLCSVYLYHYNHHTVNSPWPR